jgi:hypothetical protein
MEEIQQLLDQFPDRIDVGNENYKSYIYQPDRVSINSRQSGSYVIAKNDQDSETFSQFTVSLEKPLLKVQSLQLLRATIPNPQTSIPNTELIFFYYRIPKSLDDLPDYTQITAANIRMVRFLPDYVLAGAKSALNAYAYNILFNDYQSVIPSLAKAVAVDPITFAVGATNYFIANDLSFGFNEEYSRFTWRGTNASYFYGAIGPDDPNIATFVALLNTATATVNPNLVAPYINLTLNQRLGFSWNGKYPPLGSAGFNDFWSYRLRDGADADQIFIGNTYGNLVYTGNIYLYSSISGGSTQDTNSESQLLAVIPNHTGALSVQFIESTLDCLLTKTAQNISQITIVMKTDTAQPLLLPNNALVNIELGLKY